MIERSPPAYWLWCDGVNRDGRKCDRPLNYHNDGRLMCSEASPGQIALEAKEAHWKLSYGRGSGSSQTVARLRLGFFLWAETQKRPSRDEREGLSI